MCSLYDGPGASFEDSIELCAVSDFTACLPTFALPKGKIEKGFSPRVLQSTMRRSRSPSSAGPLRPHHLLKSPRLITPQSLLGVITSAFLTHSMGTVNEKERRTQKNVTTALLPGKEVAIDRIEAKKRPGQDTHRALSQNLQKEKKVKNQIIAAVTVAILAAISALIVGCGPDSAAPANQMGYRPQPLSPPTNAPAPEDILSNAERAAYLVTGNQIMQGLATGADLSAALQQIDDARQALAQIDEAARAAHVVIGNQIMQGLAAGSDLAAVLQELGQERQTVLNGIGLAQ